MPRVNAATEFDATGTSYMIALVLLEAAEATRIQTRALELEPVTLLIVKVDTTAEVLTGH